MSSNTVSAAKLLQPVADKIEFFEIFSNAHKTETGSGLGLMTSSSGCGLRVL